MDGPITPLAISHSIARHSTKHSIGAHAIFLGQVRADVINGKTVTGIEYSAYETMAETELTNIREDAFRNFPLACLHIYHSLGLVATGEISLFVFVSSPHRKASLDALEEIVERIKANVPVWGKEILDDGTYVWKENVIK